MATEERSVAEGGSASMNQANDVPLVDRLRSLPTFRRTEVLTELLRGYVAQKLNLDRNDIQPRSPLMSLGMSSLQSVDVKMYLETQLGTQLSTSLVFDYPTLAALVPELLRRAGLGGEIPTPGASADHRGVAEELAAELADLRRQGAL